ncbi:MAG: PAS domain-containing protein [Spirochaetaceae bacterium]|nr:PAS domain-containing protein [Myxococcales bacterium]MCB9724780.1 PAS domain-containing protein [Spirochaetaceae bacterium]HPG26457.1 PAS domain-containing protein [Myxococcota bacterium]
MAIDLDSALYANEHIVPSIYEAAAVPDCWDRAVELVTDFVDCTQGFVSMSYLTSRRAEVVASSGFPDEMIERWEERYGVNEWVMLAAGNEPGLVIHAADTVSVDQMLATPMGQDMLAPLGIRDGVGIKMSDSPHFVGALSTYAVDPIPAHALDRLRFLAPHLARGLAVYQRASMQAARAGALAAGIDALATGVALLTDDARVLYANPAAERIFDARDGVSMRDERLALARPEATRDLARAIEQVRTPDPAQPRRGLFRIARRSALRAYHAMVSPAVPALLDAPVGSTVLLWLTDPESDPVPDERTIATLLDLTPSEARVVAAIASGLSVREHAERAGIKEGTARWTLKRALAKTGARTQADLVRIVLQSIPSPPF